MASAVHVLVRPCTVILGAHSVVRKGTLLNRSTVMVLCAHGYGELCVMDENVAKSGLSRKTSPSGQPDAYEPPEQQTVSNRSTLTRTSRASSLKRGLLVTSNANTTWAPAAMVAVGSIVSVPADRSHAPVVSPPTLAPPPKVRSASPFVNTALCVEVEPSWSKPVRVIVGKPSVPIAVDDVYELQVPRMAMDGFSVTVIVLAAHG